MHTTGRIRPRNGFTMAAIWLCIMTGLLALPNGAAAQDEPASRPATEAVHPSLPSQDVIRSQITRLEQAKSLDEAVRTPALEAYKQAAAQLTIAKDWKAKSDLFEAAAKDAPARLITVKKGVAAPVSPPASVPVDATLADLESRLGQATAALAKAQRALTDLTAEPKRRADRRIEIAELTTAGQGTLNEIKKKLVDVAPDRHAELVAAERTLLQTQQEATRQAMEAYQKESVSYDTERELLAEKGTLAAREVAQADKQVNQLRVVVSQKRKAEADRAVRDADIAAASTHPALHEIAEANVALAAMRSSPDGPAAKIPEITKQVNDAKASLTRLQEDFRSLLEKEKAIGQTVTLGILLRKQRTELPDLRDSQSRIKARQAEISAIQLRLIELQDQRAAITDVDAIVRKTMAELDPSVPPAQREALTKSARTLIETQRKSFDELIRDYDTYFARLVDLDVQVRAFMAEAEDIATYIDERILWVRSAPVLRFRDMPTAVEAGQWLLAPQAWAEVTMAIWADVERNPTIMILGVLMFLVLLAMRWRLLRKLSEAGQLASRATTGVFAPTASAFAMTALLAFTVPGMVWFLGWRLAGAPDASTLVKAIAEGLTSLGTILLTFGIFRQICRPHGLAEAHFGVEASTLAPTRRTLLQLMVIVGIAGFLIAAIDGQGNEAWKNSLGRAAMIVALLTVVIATHRLLRASGTLWTTPKGAADGWLKRLRVVWYLLGTVGPIFLASLVILGYYYTAIHLASRFGMTIWLVAGLAVLCALAKRWLTVTSRRMTIRGMRKDRSGRDEAIAEKNPSGGGGADPEIELAARLGRINQQNEHLTHAVVAIFLIVGIWGIWADSLPALGVLDRVDLWSYSATVTVQATTDDGTVVQNTVEKLDTITLADVGLAILILLFTITAVRNIPGILEVTVLQRTRLDAGARYAASAILRYALAVIGFVLAVQMMGVTWSSVQWLVAAMTVGLGFGLQEIFANFVSGLIILFERPIRIGDTVTIGETAGTVSKIRIRATTITDWDRKELIVPNKEFITGRLVNWSLSDKVLRGILCVGVAYGSDTECVERTLHEIARDHPLVLAAPKPLVLFHAFGDNSLEFELRFYIGGIEHRLQTQHELNMAVDKAFRQAGITIAFPQRDTHLETREPLEIRIVPPDETEAVSPPENPS